MKCFCVKFNGTYGLFSTFYEELKDCTFVVFRKMKELNYQKHCIPNYDNDFAIINIGSTNRYYAVNSTIYRGNA